MNKAQIKKLLIDILPYGIVSKIKRNNAVRRRNLIKTDCKEELPDVKIKYPEIVCIHGFGYSGHTALLDLLREYDGCYEFGYIQNRADRAFEIDFMRLAGGLFDMERYIGSSNIFQNDSAIHRMLSQFKSVYLVKTNEECRALVSKFVSSIIEQETEYSYRFYYNMFLSDAYDYDTAIYYLKYMSVTEYRDIARKFLASLLNVFYQENHQCLFLNHFFNDFEFDIKKYNEYIPNVKILVLYRDPRDVYTFTKMKNVEWIPHNTVNNFITWCKACYRHFNQNSTEYLPIRFEELILDYNNTVNRIEKCLNLKPSQHKSPFSYLNPEISKKNVGIWKDHQGEYGEDYKVIEKELIDYCYN